MGLNNNKINDPLSITVAHLRAYQDGDMIPFDFDSPCDFMAVTELIRSTNGWITSLVDGRVCLYTHRGKSPDHERIWLPPLETLPLCQAQVVTNVTYSWVHPLGRFTNQ